MDYKEKYNAALERARQFSEHPLQEDSADIVEYIFPELKESEDESMRKALYAYIRTYIPNEREEALDWLKKQGEQLTDKIDTKFKAGDWIVDDETPNDVFCVIEVLGEIYKVIDIDGDDYHIPHCKADKQFHIWTINDAKDGDVLYSTDSKQPFIYKERPQFSQARGYCCINKFGEFAVWNTSKCIICTDKYIPATKEQRDLLFQKMKKAGYEWNSEKKELKKIEHKMLDADKVIEWLDKNANLFGAKWCHTENIIQQFKQDFGL